MQEIATFIQQVGFPIFVAVVLLLRVDQMHRENLRALHELKEELKQLLSRKVP